MNYFTRTLATLSLGASLALGALGCEPNQRIEQMTKNQAPTNVTYSVERDNINRRIALTNDPENIMWFYGIDMGKVVISSPVKGKVTSSGKGLEPKHNSGNSDIVPVANKRYATDEIMAADGTFGSSDHYVYFFTPDNHYIQWTGNYVVTSVPMKVAGSIINAENIDQEEIRRTSSALEKKLDGQ